MRPRSSTFSEKVIVKFSSNSGGPLAASASLSRKLPEAGNGPDQFGTAPIKRKSDKGITELRFFGRADRDYFVGPSPPKQKHRATKWHLHEKRPRGTGKQFSRQYQDV